MQKIKTVLKNYYSYNSVKSILCGRRKPSYSKMLELSKEGIPLNAWSNIKSFINSNTTTPKKRAQELRGVTGCDDGNDSEQTSENGVDCHACNDGESEGGSNDAQSVDGECE
ncbi:MAG: hypothetical protein LBI78_07475 [Campylobacteraceae bacterium]|nr:hypothetical protein [Campylobacteraceae bacterium]